jgi:hypothetical protein
LQNGLGLRLRRIKADATGSEGQKSAMMGCEACSYC